MTMEREIERLRRDLPKWAQQLAEHRARHLAPGGWTPPKEGIIFDYAQKFYMSQKQRFDALTMVQAELREIETRLSILIPTSCAAPAPPAAAARE
jgi:hypothetical protein